MKKYIINPITGEKILSTEFVVNDYYKKKDENKKLKRIIKELKETLEKHLTARDYSNHKYELFGREYLEELYDLLKEIK